MHHHHKSDELCPRSCPAHWVDPPPSLHVAFQVEQKDIESIAKSHGHSTIVLFLDGTYACSCGVKRLEP